MTVKNGDALEQFVRARWGRDKGGIRGLAAALHVAPDSVYAWFRDEAAPDTDQLERLAELLAVRRFEIVAAMDGEPEVLPLNAATRSAFLALIEEWADRRGLPRPRQGSGTESGAA